ncbi:MAG: DUF1572 family protein [Bacteroidota bacterium]|nr:DUF1572 family protein [Bacteroidota bacterium]
MDFIYFFERDMKKLTEEINLYQDESELWKTKGSIANSAGNLTLHLIGNLNQLIGNYLGNTGYVREREKEFSQKNIPREKLISEINAISDVIKNTLPNLSDEDWKKDFQQPINNVVFSTENVMVLLLTHLNYHLGQINYHRRLI